MNRYCIPVLCIAIVACEGRDESSASTTTFSTIGDTTVATIALAEQLATTSLVPEQVIGQADGADEYLFAGIGDVAVGLNDEVYVWDWRSGILRLYDSSGTFVRQVGGKGAGPGEYDRINGMAVRGDGRLVVWDAGNARLNVYSASGDHEKSWRLPAGHFTSRAVLSDSAGHTYLRSSIGRDSATQSNIDGFEVFDADGAVIDSIEIPAFGPQPPQLVATRATARVVYPVPNYPSARWTVGLGGDLLVTPGDPYVVYTLPKNGNALKIVRQFTGPEVDPGERDEQRALWLAMLRMSVPDYEWDGPAPRATKPAVRDLHVDLDGRIWVQVSQPSERIPEAERITQSGSPLPPSSWREPVAFDVFTANGHLVGHVQLPRRTVFYQARGNRVWATTLDSLDIPAVTRFRLEPAFAQPPRTR